MRRHRVRLRPKARRRRAAALQSWAVAACLALSLAWTARERPWSSWSWRVPWPRGWLLKDLSVEGVPEDFAALLREASGWGGESWGPWGGHWAAFKLKRAFPCLAALRADLDWSARRVRLEAEPRRPLARVQEEGGTRYLDASGEEFEAPEGLYGGAELMELDLRRMSAKEPRRAVALFLGEAEREAQGGARIVWLGFESSQDGFRARLADGTRLRWGDLRWTREKFGRLREVLEDASRRFPGGVSVDLRRFSEGRIVAGNHG